MIVMKNAGWFAAQPELTQWNIVLGQTLTMPWGDGLEATTLFGADYKGRKMIEWLDHTFALRAEQVIGCTRELGLGRALQWSDAYHRTPVADVESVLSQNPDTYLRDHFPSCYVGFQYVVEGIMSRQGHAELADWPQFSKYLREKTKQSNLTIDTVGILVQMIRNGGTLSGVNRVEPKDIVCYFEDPEATIRSLGFCKAD
jgi:hypothetical protein